MTTPHDYSKLDGTIPLLNRKMHRSKTNSVLFGVLGGIGETYDVDPNLLRVLAVVASLFTGIPVVIYIAAVVLMWNT
ncbi:PspC domain-containing protein [Corynebacterium hindlerae]|uniref:PspC domain-containing protein n=1 Tax=Corynebacterium hindlerae TaxID=699041 RepID=A0A7G5FEL5_9CORY|nr:PspC domain-containing protein [Corynebacterium hindlerae]QMV85056.1 PspC domain-containing protein [Corynebacterium hindlerae]